MMTFALIDQVSHWWQALTMAQQVFFGIGILAGFVSLILAVLAVFGLEHHDAIGDASFDFDHGGGGIFSVKPLTGFFLGFGWAGGMALAGGFSVGVATLIAAVSGIAIMALIVGMLRAIYSFRSDGTMRIQDAVGVVATVYLTLPARRAGGGQVIVNVNGRQETLPALSTAERPVASGEKVKVLQVIDARTLLVEPLA